MLLSNLPRKLNQFEHVNRFQYTSSCHRCFKESVVHTHWSTIVFIVHAWPWSISSQTNILYNIHKLGGFNPFEKHISQTGSFPQVGVNMNVSQPHTQHIYIYIYIYICSPPPPKPTFSHCDEGDRATETCACNFTCWKYSSDRSAQARVIFAKGWLIEYNEFFLELFFGILVMLNWNRLIFQSLILWYFMRSILGI